MSAVPVVRIGDDRGVQALLYRVDTALNPVAMAEFLGTSVDPYIRHRAEQRFQSEGDDVSGRWLPLADATQAIRAASGYGASGPINVRTGELEAYVVGTPGISTPEAYGASLTSPGIPPTGELEAKVRTAQSGKDNPRTPPRPVIGMNEGDLAAVLTMLSGFFIERMQ